MSSETSIGRRESHRPYIYFTIILICGLALRIFLSNYLTYYRDFNVWRGWGAQAAEVGLNNFYEIFWCDYMPGYIYVLYALNWIHETLPGIKVEMLYKLPANLADLGISVLIMFSLRRITSVRNSIIGGLVYFFNPAALANSTFWGQVDSFHAFPILLSILLALDKRFLLSGIALAAAFMIKPQSIVLFPVVGFLSLGSFYGPVTGISRKTLMQPLKLILGVAVTTVLLTLPYIADDFGSFSYVFTGPVDLIRDRFDAAYQQYRITSLNAFNFWGAVAMWENDELRVLGLKYKTIGTIIFGSVYATVFALLFAYDLRRRSLGDGNFRYILFSGVFLMLFALFLFVTRAHERHLLPAIVFFTVIAHRSWVLWYCYGIVSSVYVVNMVYSYIQLTTEYEGISLAYTNILSLSMFLLYLSVFIIVFLYFLKYLRDGRQAP